MGLFDTLRGRTKQVPPDLDAIFALPSGAVTLDTELDLKPSGCGGLCLKAGSGESAVTSEQELRDLLNLDEQDHNVQLTDDDLGFKWLVINDPDLSNLVTRIHGANSTMVDNGLGPRLLCAVFGFVPKTPPGEGDV